MLHGDHLGQASSVVMGCERCLSCNRMVTGGGGMLLGGRVAHVGCQTHRERLRWGTAGQCSRYCHGTVLLPVSIGRILLQKFQVFFCTGSRPSTANVLTASPLLGQYLPHSTLSNGLPMGRLVVRRTTSLLISSLLPRCPLHTPCLQKERCSTEPFTTCSPC